MNTCPFADIRIKRRLDHANIGQSPKTTTKDPDEPRNIDIFLLVRRATATVTQRRQKDALSRLWLIRSQLKLGRKFLTDHLTPSNPGPGTHRIQPTRITVDQLKIIG